MSKKHNPKVLFIFGPTAVGKTALVDDLVAHLGAEIVNLDVGQFYTPLIIGTAKPDTTQSRVSCHLFDIINTPRSLSVTTYFQLLKKCIAEIHERGNHAIVVGGSGFYLHSLFFPPMVTTEPASHHVNKVQQSISLWEDLANIDPVRASALNPSDHYRISRALAIWQETGIKPSEVAPLFKPIVDRSALVCLMRDKSDLHERINRRVEQMIHNGWIDEVERLAKTPWKQFLLEKKIIGYAELFDYLDNHAGELLDTTKESIKMSTRHYAKRQIIFWKRLKKNLEKHQEGAPTIFEINLTHVDYALYLNPIIEWLQTSYS